MRKSPKCPRSLSSFPLLLLSRFLSLILIGFPIDIPIIQLLTLVSVTPTSLLFTSVDGSFFYLSQSGLKSSRGALSCSSYAQQFFSMLLSFFIIFPLGGRNFFFIEKLLFRLLVVLKTCIIIIISCSSSSLSIMQ